MSLRETLRSEGPRRAERDLYGRYGLFANPFPPSSQTAGHPHQRSAADDAIEGRVVSFMKDHRSQVVVVEGTQGVGKTNLLNFWESEIEDALGAADGYYVIRYLSDPEASFDGTLRRLFQELGVEHIQKLAGKLSTDRQPVSIARSPDMRSALHKIADDPTDLTRMGLFRDWLLGLRLLKSHREVLDVQFRLDTVESKTAAMRDIVVVSSEVGILEGIFLLLDEVEKQEGVLGPTGIVRYLSGLRAIIDALPQHLFMMLALTPDALRRYSAALPAFRSRLQNQVTLQPLDDEEKALELARFYIDHARKLAEKLRAPTAGGRNDLVDELEIRSIFQDLRSAAAKRGDAGVRQRELLHILHNRAESVIARSNDSSSP